MSFTPTEIAKLGLVLGAPLISIMFSAYDEEIQAGITVPIALFQGVSVSGGPVH